MYQFLQVLLVFTKFPTKPCAILSNLYITCTILEFDMAKFSYISHFLTSPNLPKKIFLAYKKLDSVFLVKIEVPLIFLI